MREIWWLHKAELFMSTTHPVRHPNLPIKTAWYCSVQDRFLQSNIQTAQAPSGQCRCITKKAGRAPPSSFLARGTIAKKVGHAPAKKKNQLRHHTRDPVWHNNSTEFYFLAGA